jgi:DNA-binding FadR family transcriptional regulator
MGVLETRRGAGTFVTSLDSRLLLAPMGFMIDLQTPEHRHHLHAVRRVLEAEAAGRAALTITNEQLAEATAVLERVHSQVFDDHATDHEAIMQADVAFHRLVARATDNAALAALVDAFSDMTLTARRAIGVHDLAHMRRSHRVHVAILDALRQGDADRARLLMSHHLLATEDHVREDQVAPNTDGVDGSLVPIAQGGHDGFHVTGADGGVG